MPQNEGSTLVISVDEENYDEEWEIVINTGGKYTLNKEMARFIRQEIANGNRGIIQFQTFAISIPYIAEFYRVRRFLKDAVQLPERTTEKPYEPIPPDKWEELKKEAYRKIGISKVE